ncbi:MAG: xanthine dehydrogenase family protein subunit M, partial [Rhizobium pusense]|nr:xanthine dehydrogenase family protein subunit M [Agrobacterium pusense]
HVGLPDFILGNRRTARRDDELVTSIRIGKASASGRSAFVKLGARRYLVISIAMAAARIVSAPDGTVSRSAVAVGACSAVAQRLGLLEQSLLGRTAASAADRVEDGHLASLAPIDDVRGSADYRRQAARTIASRALAAATADHLRGVAA